MQLVLRGHKTKREADYGSKKIGSFTEKRERESKAGGREGGVRPKSLSQDVGFVYVCHPSSSSMDVINGWHPRMEESSMDAIHGWHFNPWMTFQSMDDISPSMDDIHR